jgi:hypothetical protein
VPGLLGWGHEQSQAQGCHLERGYEVTLGPTPVGGGRGVAVTLYISEKEKLKQTTDWA